jgi:hypothetical protein
MTLCFVLEPLCLCTSAGQKKLHGLSLRTKYTGQVAVTKLGS